METLSPAPSGHGISNFAVFTRLMEGEYFGEVGDWVFEGLLGVCFGLACLDGGWLDCGYVYVGWERFVCMPWNVVEVMLE